MIASCGMDLVLCAMEAGSGRVRFGPRLSYALPVAELAVEAAGRTAHTLRHTAAMRLLLAGNDITVIALWVGHEQVTTTQIYLHKPT